MVSVNRPAWQPAGERGGRVGGARWGSCECHEPLGPSSKPALPLTKHHIDQCRPGPMATKWGTHRRAWWCWTHYQRVSRKSNRRASKFGCSTQQHNHHNSAPCTLAWRQPSPLLSQRRGAVSCRPRSAPRVGPGRSDPDGWPSRRGRRGSLRRGRGLPDEHTDRRPSRAAPSRAQSQHRLNQ